jgi:hypothetical protein
MAGFLDLRPELRLMIYTHYFDKTLHKLESPTWWSRAHKLTDYMDRSKDWLHLVHTSRLILREALPIYHAAMEFHLMNIQLFLQEIQCAMELQVRPLDRLLRRKPLFFLRLMDSARLTERSWSTWNRIEATVILKESNGNAQNEYQSAQDARVSLLDGVMQQWKTVRELDRTSGN